MQLVRSFGWRASLALNLLVVASWTVVRAQTLVYQATGTREQIQPVIDQFKRDIVWGPGALDEAAGSGRGEYRVATMDDVSAGDAARFVSGGLQLVVGGADTFHISPNLDAYSPPNAFTMTSVALWDRGALGVYWSHPPSESIPYQNAFGAVFANVSASSPAVLSDAAGYFVVPVTAGPGTYSFLGVLNERSLFQVGNIQLSGVPAALPSEGLNDLVAVDEVILGHTAELPEPSTILLLSIPALLVLRRLRPGSAARRAIPS